MTQFFGAPDYQSQQAQTVSNLGPVTVTGNVTQFVDLTGVLQPYHQTLWVHWKATTTYTGNGVLLTVSDSPGIEFIQPLTLLPDGGGTYIDCNAQWANGLPLGGPLLTISVPAGVPGTMEGTLQIVAFTELIPNIPVPHIPTPFNTTGMGNVSVLTLATTTIKPAAASGTYHRVKMLSWAANAAPAAVAALQFELATGAVTFIHDTIQAVAGQSRVIPCDFLVAEPIQFHNFSSITIAVSGLYEVHPI